MTPLALILAVIALTALLTALITRWSRPPAPTVGLTEMIGAGRYSADVIELWPEGRRKRVP
jgi:hypothetical protein